MSEERERGRGFRSPKSVVEEHEAINNVVPASTSYKMKWAVVLDPVMSTAVTDENNGTGSR